MGNEVRVTKLISRKIGRADRTLAFLKLCRGRIPRNDRRHDHEIVGAMDS
jgi:hypothetical protein